MLLSRCKVVALGDVLWMMSWSEPAGSFLDYSTMHLPPVVGVSMRETPKDTEFAVLALNSPRLCLFTSLLSRLSGKDCPISMALLLPYALLVSPMQLWACFPLDLLLSNNFSNFNAHFLNLPTALLNLNPVAVGTSMAA